MKTAAIIVNHNSEAKLIPQLRRLLSYDAIDETIVVDSASDPGSLEKLEVAAAEYIRPGEERLHIIRSERNLGYGTGNDLGMEYAAERGYDYVLIANPDTICSEKCITELMTFLAAHPDTAVCAPLMKRRGADASELVPGTRRHVLSGASAWPVRGWLGELCENGPVCRRLFTSALHYPESFYSGKAQVYVGAVSGALLMADLKLLLRAGGYDRDIFMYEEETVLGFRLRELGLKTVLLLTSSYIHDHEETGAADTGRQRMREAAVMTYFKKYLKAGPFRRAVSFLFFRIVEAEARLAGIFRRYT